MDLPHDPTIVVLYLLVCSDCGDDFQPGWKLLDVSGQEGSQRVAIIRPVELGLVQAIDQHDKPRLLHVQLPLWKGREQMELWRRRDTTGRQRAVERV